ncbi:glycosyltransferase family 4 protein [Mucilaginibacter gotjawali]|uniref:Glycosyltransferase involved in cell wall biosynthesis n=1 Tax=Mucilaginibacter gotjawali TaxID=1550579 RepID=A0A839SDK5_9SPHI|nr:glycosyltransferase family 4 protein [Mucilaginibacter gotjawali]MBB3054647.1 glycosyltransferase involved in cell wall biosynthesis [Mucilaginibacter gotjawali]
MTYVFVSFAYLADLDSPESWFERTAVYSGVLERLSKENTVHNIIRINYRGKCEHNGVVTHFVDFGKNKAYFPFGLIRFIKSLKPDILFIQGLHQPLQLISSGLLLGGKTKVIVQHHAEKPFTGVKKYLQRTAGRFVGAYLFAAASIGIDWVKRGNIASAGKIHEVMEVSSCFYPMKRAAAKLITGAEGVPVFLWVGRLNANKDPLNVVKAFLKFTETNPGARLYMIYHTEELLNEIKQEVEKAAVKNAITMVGEVPHEELLYWFNSADFFISGSHYEGSGTALCEAMACGCVPLVTDIFSFRTMTDNGKCGLLYEPGNQKALLAALEQTKHLDIAEKRARSLAYFKQNLSFEAIAAKIQHVAAGL